MKPAIGRPRPPEEPTDKVSVIIAIIILLVMAAGVVAAEALAAQVLQGDWHCAFRRCILVQSR